MPVLGKLPSPRFALAYLYALGSSAYLFTGGLRDRRHRALILQICHHFGYRYGRTAGRLATVPASDCAPESTPIVLREPVDRTGNVTLLELLVICRVARAAAPSAIMELG